MCRRRSCARTGRPHEDGSGARLLARADGVVVETAGAKPKEDRGHADKTSPAAPRRTRPSGGHRRQGPGLDGRPGLRGPRRGRARAAGEGRASRAASRSSPTRRSCSGRATATRCSSSSRRMDAAGKDSAIKHVMSGVNPQGVQVVSFKQPSAEELDHDFLWRIAEALPERGPHRHLQPVALRGGRRARRCIPSGSSRSASRPAIAASGSGRSATRTSTPSSATSTATARRSSSSSSTSPRRSRSGGSSPGSTQPGKEWKFNAADVAERAHWDDYMGAFEDAITATSTPWAPWYVIPADHKQVTQALVARGARRDAQVARPPLARGLGRGPRREPRGPQEARGRGRLIPASARP